MKVNMTPNPLDVVTIHASQGDTEARQWEFELHNNGELIDTSEITEQLFFKAYKGGTEQILPENTSTPTTSPFKGDIRYPQGLLTDQEFTYRQSPTESDGLAKITDIKGNTLVWNQLQLIPTNSSTTSNGITFTNNNDGSVTANGTATGTAIFYCNSFSLTSGHKYLFKGCPSGGTNNTYMQSIRVNSASTIIGTDVGNGDVYTANANYTDGSILLRILSGVTLNNAKFYPQVFDLTQMGLDSITDPAEFTSLFPLSYYSYNQGSLLSFMGNGIKTTGENNMFGVGIRNNTNWIYQNAPNRAIIEFDVEPSTQYTIKIDYSSNIFQATAIFKEGYVNYQITNRALGSGVKEFTVTTPSNCRVLCIQFESNASVTIADSDFPNRNSWYCLKDPSQIATLSLPISTYFPNGMKSAGNVYDELTESKAITKIGEIDLGTLSWGYASSVQRFYALNFANVKTNAENVLANINCALYENSIWSQVQGDTTKNKVVSVANKNILIRDTTYTDPTAFKTAMSGVYLYYELANPTETSFATASLVTENAEIPLSAENDVLVGKCTEELSAQSGFIDAKIKLTDGDGTCYSNKIQLHVERKPS